VEEDEKTGNHNKYFKEFAALTVSVEKALAYFATHPDTVLGCLGATAKKAAWHSKQAA